MKILRLAVTAAALLLSFEASVQAQTTLRIGLAEDPDILDPTLGRTYVGRIVFASFCDKLFDIDEKINIVPQLALSHETSADGTGHATACHRMAELPAPDSIVPSDGGFSPVLEKLVAAFSGRAEGAPRTGVDIVGTRPAAV